jgi:hypothetical protein
MNGPYQQVPKAIRAAFAVVALVATVMIGGGIDALAGHYQTSAVAAAAPPVQLARR